MRGAALAQEMKEFDAFTQPSFLRSAQASSDAVAHRSMCCSPPKRAGSGIEALERRRLQKQYVHHDSALP
jgi:hypothetical protein